MKKEWVSPKLEMLQISETASGGENTADIDKVWTTYEGTTRIDHVSYRS